MYPAVCDLARVCLVRNQNSLRFSFVCRSCIASQIITGYLPADHNILRAPLVISMEQRHSGAQLRMNRGFWQGFRFGFEFWVWVELRTQMRMRNHLAVRRLDKCRRSHARAGLGNDVNVECRMPHGVKGMPTEGGTRRRRATARTTFHQLQNGP